MREQGSRQRARRTMHVHCHSDEDEGHSVAQRQDYHPALFLLRELPFLSTVIRSSCTWSKSCLPERENAMDHRDELPLEMTAAESSLSEECDKPIALLLLLATLRAIAVGSRPGMARTVVLLHPPVFLRKFLPEKRSRKFCLATHSDSINFEITDNCICIESQSHVKTLKKSQLTW